MLNKKTLIFSAVALSLTGANAKDLGIKFGGGIGGAYENNVKDKESKVTTNSFELYGARVKATKDFSNGVSIYSEINAKDEEGVKLDAISLGYAANDNLSISVGKDYYGIVGFNDQTSSYSSTFRKLGGSTFGGDYLYGGSINYNANELNVLIGGGISKGGNDLFDREVKDGTDNSKIKSFAGSKDSDTKVAVRVDYTTNNVNVGLGYLYNSLKKTTTEDNEVESGAALSSNVFAADVSYANNGLFVLASTQYSIKDDYAINEGTNFKDYTMLDIVGTLLYGINGEFNNYGSVKTADNLVYIGGQFESIKEEVSIEDASASRTTTNITGILGYAPSKDVILTFEYTKSKIKESNGGDDSKVTTNIALVSRLAF
ncbi:MAG: hypothetical protein LBT02_03045 [Rickettsiales bacterium]|jgi:hypothetical protein|nr:hypothetical protein [Rickettsiales bacterium]